MDRAVGTARVGVDLGKLGGDGYGNALVWGVFREPVSSVRVEIEGREPFEPAMYAPPVDYPDAHSLFVFEYRGDEHVLFSGTVVGLDANGDEVTDPVTLG